MTGAALVVQGDALQLPLPDSSVDAICTDPPYGLEFMGKDWDGANGFRRALNPADVARDNQFGRLSARGPEYRAGKLYQAWCEQWATEALRVLKPGGWLLAFGGTRTWHRLACGIEDAGFEMRDTIAEFSPLAWVTGQGFPKGKACLKPAWEPVLVARKPGSSVLQIDAARIGHASPDDLAASQAKNPGRADLVTSDVYGTGRPQQSVNGAGRWPSNVALIHDSGCVPVGVRKIRNHDGPKDAPRLVSRDDETDWRFKAGEQPGYGTETVTAWDCQPDCPVRLLDQQSGETRSRSGGLTTKALGRMNDDAWVAKDLPRTGHDDQGGASRFYPTFQTEPRLFYTAKAPRNERVTIQTPTERKMLRLRDDLTDEQRSYVLSELQRAGIGVPEDG